MNHRPSSRPRWSASRLAVAAWLAALLAAVPVRAEVSVSGIEVYPPDLRLTTQRDLERVIVVAVRDDGVTLDVTSEAEFEMDNAELVRREGHTFYPLADGQTQLTVRWQGHQAQVPVEVERAQEERPISFQLDVMPVFMHAGCNMGSCHGSARGKDGFALSLFGFDPLGDHFRLTRENPTRRINLAVPERSLLIEKSVGAVPHTGGKRFDEDSEYHETLVRWLETGAPADETPPPAVESVELYPPRAVLEGSGADQQFIVRANYSDGTSRDVTSLAVFLSNNDNSAAIDAEGRVTAGARGEAFVMARFETHTVGSQVLVLPEQLEYSPPPTEGNYIDQLVSDKLRTLRLEPSELSSDEQFLRRVTLDITGLLPTEEEYHAFLADTSPDKRARWIDELLSRKEFSEIWAMKWAELLMVKSTPQFDYKAMFLYHTWLTDKIANNVPLDEMVRELLSSSGGTFNEPATNFYQIERDTLKTSENVAQIFMGIRTQCAQCHNHPFDRWTMDDYYSFAAFFAQIGRKQGEDYRETIVFDRQGGNVRHPLDNQVMRPRFLGGEQPDLNGLDRRELLAEWLTSPENPYFSTSVANRVWDHFFGQGIVDPVDDIRVSNPPSNPELFETLGQKLIEYNYDFKQLVRDICNSHAYQRSSVPNDSNADDHRNFARASVRRIPAETLLDSISQVTGTEDKFRGLPLGARAVQIADGRTTNYFLTTFGRAPRDTACTCESSTDPSLSQALHLLNGQAVHGKIVQGGLVRELVDAGQLPEEVIETLYVRCLTRSPTEAELKQLLTIVSEADNPRAGLEDVFWAILNSREFLFNH